MNKREMAIGVGEMTAIDLFLCMLNAKTRGHKFKWSEFTEMASRLASSQCVLSIPNPISIKIKHLAAEAADRMAKRCLKQSGVEDWMPLDDEKLNK